MGFSRPISWSRGCGTPVAICQGVEATSHPRRRHLPPMFTPTARRSAKSTSLFRSCCAKTVVEVVGNPEPRSSGWVRFVADEGLLLESEQLFDADVSLVLHVLPREGSALLVAVRVSRCNRLP